jgi:RNA-directed DNA polymerase
MNFHQSEGSSPSTSDWMIVCARLNERMLALIRKWLKAGVIEGGRWVASDAGTPQGSSISPVLANAYLHYVFDLWAQQWRGRHARGEVIIVRWVVSVNIPP